MKELYREQLKEFACHLRHYFIAYILLAALLAAMVWRQEQQIQKTQQILTWPAVTTIIKSSTVTERSHASEYDPPRTRISIALEIQYRVDSTTYNKKLFRSFTRISNTDYNALLAPGNNIQIKYNPDKPTQIALLPPLPN